MKVFLHMRASCNVWRCCNHERKRFQFEAHNTDRIDEAHNTENKVTNSRIEILSSSS